MTFDDVWKSLEERDTTGKYKQAREMAELNVEQLEYAYNSGYADAKSKYERTQGEPVIKCQDCKYRVKEWREDKRMKEKGYWVYGCEHFGEIMGYWGFGGNDNEFCSDAEQKDGDDNDK